MGRTAVFLVAAVVILGPTISLTAAGSMYPTDVFNAETVGDRTTTGAVSVGGGSQNNTANSTTKPGAQFVGVIGAHREQHSGAVEEQSVDVRLSKADTPNQKAAIVATIHQTNEQRLDKLAQRRQELTKAYQNGSLTESEYRARITTLDVEIRSVEQVAIRLENTADGLPLSSLLEVGLDPEALRSLRSRAHGLQGSELYSVAPSFARNRSQSEPGPPGPSQKKEANETLANSDRGANASVVLATADTEVQTAQDQVNQANQTIDPAVAPATVSNLLNRAQQTSVWPSRSS